MPAPTPNAILCSFLRGAFSAERVFKLRLADGGEYLGAAALQYCYDLKDQRLNANEPGPEAELPGKLIARVIREGDEDGTVLVSVPDGEVVYVRRDRLTTIQGVAADVPVQS